MIIIEHLEEREDVYDITVEDNHNFYANGIVVHNCGEQSLPTYGICNLSSINLSQLVKNPFTEESQFDWEEFAQVTEVAIRFSDNVVDEMEYPLPEIENLQMKSRRIGVGITGLGSALAMMGMTYGDEASVDFVDKMGYNLMQNSIKTSALLAKEKGKYKLFKYKDYIKTPMYESISDENKKLIKKHGMRNVALNTVAPVGTGSMAIGLNCSSGIEPIFATEYDRKIRIGEEGDTKTETVYEYSYLLAKEMGLDPKIKTIEEIDPYDAMKVQSALQAHLDSNISKCVSMNTLIQTSEGLKYMRELSTNRKEDSFKNENIEIINKEGKIEKADGYYYNGIKDCVRITLSNGVQITATPEHKLMTDEGWEEMKDIGINRLLHFKTITNYTWQKKEEQENK